MNELKCCICRQDLANQEQEYRHIINFHAKDTALMISCNECTYTTSNLERMRSHFNVKHHLPASAMKNLITFLNSAAGDFRNPALARGLEEQDPITLRMAKLSLDMETRFHVNQEGLNFLCKKVLDVVNLANSRESYNIKIPELLTEKRRRTYYKENFNFLTPEPVFLGIEEKLTPSGVKNIKQYGRIIPLIESLKALLRIPDVRRFCCTRTPRDASGYYKGVYGYSEGEEAVLYLSSSKDEIQVQNPIGQSTKKHKVYVGHYELLNIPPEYRSPLQTKQQIFVAHSKFIKAFGIAAILSDFVQTLKDGQYPLDLGVPNFKFRLKLVYSTCDTLGANYMFGFKESVGRTIQFCRTCNISRIVLTLSFDSTTYSMRTLEEHLETLKKILEITKEKGPKSSKLKNFQKDTGVVFDSPLVSELPDGGIDICPHDVMHIILEGGCLAIELQNLLYRLIKVDKLFSLKSLNLALEGWKFNDRDLRNKPPPFPESVMIIGKKINIQAICLYVLCQELPFVLERWVQPENPYLLNFNRMLQISQLCLWSTINSETSIGELRLHINIHHREFERLYNTATITPKMHYATHLPDQIRKFGPLRFQSTLRYEAHYAILKSHKYKNFKNIALSVSVFHQKYMVQKMIDENGNVNKNFLNVEPSFISVQQFNIDNVPIAYESALENLHFDSIVDAVEWGNVTYKPHLFIELSHPCQDEPEFGQIELVAVENKNIFVFVKKYSDCLFIPHLCAYRLDKFEYAIVSLNSLACRLICPHRRYGKTLHVIRKQTGRLQLF